VGRGLRKISWEPAFGDSLFLVSSFGTPIFTEILRINTITSLYTYNVHVNTLCRYICAFFLSNDYILRGFFAGQRYGRLSVVTR